MSNFINDAVFGKDVGQFIFPEEWLESPIVKLIVFVGALATSGYFILRFTKEFSILFV